MAPKRCASQHARLARKNAPEEWEPYGTLTTNAAPSVISERSTRPHDEETEPAEDEPRRTDMDGRGAEQPDEASPRPITTAFTGSKVCVVAATSSPPITRSGGVGHQVPETSMQEGFADDTIQPTEVPWDQSERRVPGP